MTYPPPPSSYPPPPSVPGPQLGVPAGYNYPNGQWAQPTGPGLWLAQSKNGVGTAALVFGILGLTIFSGIGSIVAVILGHMGLKAAKQGLASNRGSSVAGVVMGYIGLALILLAVIAAILLWRYYPSNLGMCHQVGCSV